MALSANSLIHYTAKIENLLGILSSKGLRYSYCEERIKTRGGKSFSAAIAMVSFCDIPLSDYKKHFYNKKNTNDLGYYGDYGIGLSKDWANKHALNSVFYLEYNSYVGTELKKQYTEFSESNVSDKNSGPHPFLYCKNYEGELIRNGKSVNKKYRFYDEREWRIIPTEKMLGGRPPVINPFIYRLNKNTHNKNISTYQLPFELKDISYIIVREEREVPIVYKELTRIFQKELIDLTYVRVLTSKQIVSDF